MLVRNHTINISKRGFIIKLDKFECAIAYTVVAEILVTCLEQIKFGQINCALVRGP